jgi:hypothetical protein
LKKAFFVLLLSGTFALAACGSPEGQNTSVKTSHGASTSASQLANNSADSSVSSNQFAVSSSKASTNISIKGVSPKVSKQTVSTFQTKVNEITSLNNKLSQGEQDVSINAK